MRSELLQVGQDVRPSASKFRFCEVRSRPAVLFRPLVYLGWDILKSCGSTGRGSHFGDG